MKQFVVRKVSSALALCAVVFAVILKPAIYSPEMPKDLRK